MFSFRQHKHSNDAGTPSETRRSSKSSKSSTTSKSGKSSESARSPNLAGIPIHDDCLFDVPAGYVPWANSDNHVSFAYAGPELGGAQIRLFRVEITSSGQAIGWLERFDIATAPAYKALSYTWGDETVYQKVLVNGSAFPVAKNLIQFLGFYAAKHPNEYIWIDQICIAQRSTDERNLQVQLMSRIFRRAIEVLIWISPSEDLECRIHNQRRHWYGGEGPWECDKLRDLLTNNYWSRVWILQEVLLGRSRTVWYGRRILTWRELHRLADANVSHNGPPVPTQLEWLLQNPPASRFQSIDLAEAIANCCLSRCKDPRDKVYALQGLIPQSQQVQVDYRKSVRDVFIDAAIIYPTCSDSVGGLLSLAQSMGIYSRRGSAGGTVLALLYETLGWYDQWGLSRRSEEALRSKLSMYLLGPDMPDTPHTPPAPIPSGNV